MEADVWLDDGRVSVSHTGLAAKGTLRELYLDPLQALVDQRGSVHGDGARFTLWIDIKDDDAELERALERLLARYPMFEGPVEAVLTGDAERKASLASAVAPCPAARDSNDFGPDDPPADAAWRYYALDWSRYVGWDGEGTIDGGARERLACIVHNAHALGRRVRFYATPDVESVWRASLDAGVDFVGTDRVAELGAFLASYGE